MTTEPRPNTPIRTRYVGPVGLRGTRIAVTGNGRRYTAPYDHGARDPHRMAAAGFMADRLGIDPNTTDLVERTDAATPTRRVFDIVPTTFPACRLGVCSDPRRYADGVDTAADHEEGCPNTPGEPDTCTHGTPATGGTSHPGFTGAPIYVTHYADGCTEVDASADTIDAVR